MKRRNSTPVLLTSVQALSPASGIDRWWRISTQSKLPNNRWVIWTVLPYEQHQDWLTHTSADRVSSTMLSRQGSGPNFLSAAARLFVAGSEGQGIRENILHPLALIVGLHRLSPTPQQLKHLGEKALCFAWADSFSRTDTNWTWGPEGFKMGEEVISLLSVTWLSW